MAKFRIPKINLTIQLLLIIAFVACFHTLLSTPVQAALYAISLNIKEALVFVLPVIIFCCIYSCMLSFKDKALTFMVIIMAGVCVSNFVAAWLGFGISHLTLHNIQLAGGNGIQPELALTPLWTFSLPSWLANEIALLIGLAVGTIFSLFPNERADKLSKHANKFVHIVLNKLFVPILPIFALGFVVKMAHDGILDDIVHKYIWVVAIILSSYILYISFLFAVAANFQLKRWWIYVKNVMPAGIMGFSSMSSLAAMPVNIYAAEINTGKPVAARAVIPATVNIHLIGDSIFIPVLAIALLITNGLGMPSPEAFFIFSVYFIIAKFAVAGVPGGGIIVMIPILEKYLGFNTDMSALITSIYILFDPVNTGANVMGNGAFAILVTRFFKKPATDKPQAV